MSWDMFVTVLLVYIAVMLPYTLGFEEGKETIVDQSINYLFLIDVALNFRTGYTDSEGMEVLDGARVAKYYLRTWFALDFFSSLPVEHMMSFATTAGVAQSLAIPNLQPAKLLKIGKIAKVFKVMKIGNILASLGENSEIADAVEEMLVSSDFLGLVKLLYLCVLTSFVAHWLACGMGIFSDDVSAGFFGAGASQPVGESTFDRYLCAVYWAITTMATVGYGDFVPTSNMERGYAMFAMIVGAAFYGYMIGIITSQVAEGDAHTKAYYERMKKIAAWCDHQEFPRVLRRRVRRYFKFYFTEKSALDDKAIMEDLSQDLRNEITEFLIHPFVRNHMMFESLPPPVFSKLVHVLEKNTYAAGDEIVNAHGHCTAMYVLISGEATLSTPDTARTLQPGDSFGEAILLGLTQRSYCSVRADTECACYEVPYQEFRVAFQATPDVIETMRDQMRQQSASVLVDTGLRGLLDASAA
jgi:CRP-like cAMP-binding protein